MQTNFKLGCDPEIFLQDAAGALVAVCDRIGGSKQYPLPLPIGDGFAVQEDNVALEFNIPPADSEDMLVDHMTRVKECLAGMVQAQGLQFSTISAASFDPYELLHPQAQEFGCDPDFNAWTRKKNPRPKADDPNLRSCGGHIHVGYKFAKKRDVYELIKFMDLHLGVPSIVMDQGDLRKQLYGKAGCFRVKPYGAEYRTLSNFWVFDSNLIRWVWKATTNAIHAWNNSQQLFAFQDDTEKLVQDAINNNKRDIAQHLIGKHNLMLV